MARYYFLIVQQVWNKIVQTHFILVVFYVVIIATITKTLNNINLYHACIYYSWEKQPPATLDE